MRKPHKGIVLLLLALTQLLVVLDSAIINVALPAIKAAMHFNTASLQWVITAYILTFGGFLMLGGRAADLYGRRRVLVSGVVGFTAASLLIGLSGSGTQLIVLRSLQGLAGAFMSPAALSILLTTFEEGHERNQALSVWSIVASGGAAVGVFLGGVLTQYLGWRWNFFVNVPLGIAAVFGIMHYVPAHIQESKDKHLDIPGAVLITGGMLALVYALSQAPQVGWFSPTTLGILAVGGLMIGGFIFNERRAAHPLVPFSIFKIRNVTGGNLVMLPVVAGALGLFFFASLYVQNVLGYTPVLTGLCFLPIPVIIGTLSFMAPKLLERFGYKTLSVAGIGAVTLGTFGLSLLPANANYFVNLLPSFVLMGLGFGVAFVAVTVAATTGVPADQTGLASGLVNTAQQMGGAVGIAVLASIASGVTAAARAAGTPAVAASLQGYRQAFLWASVMTFMALLAAIFIIREPKRPAAVTAP